MTLRNSGVLVDITGSKALCPSCGEPRPFKTDFSEPGHMHLSCAACSSTLLSLSGFKLDRKPASVRVQRALKAGFTKPVGYGTDV